jgi:hypothetical protein
VRVARENEQHTSALPSVAVFDRDAWREGLEELDPAARAAMARVSAAKERPDIFDIDRMLAGLGAEAELEGRQGD